MTQADAPVDNSHTPHMYSTYRDSVKWGIKLVGLIAVVALTVHWVGFKPVAVHEHLVSHGELIGEVMGTGTLEAHVKASISSKISGRIHTIAVDQGDAVTRGQVLVTLDDDELQRQVEIAQADLEAAEAAIDRLKTDEIRAEAILTQTRSERQRIEQLAAKNAVTQADLEKSLEALAIADAGVAHAKYAFIEGRKQLNSAEKTCQYHQARLADTQIQAPVDGLIVQRQRDMGDVVVPGSPILTLISTDQLWISAWVDETEMARLKVDQPARVIFRAAPSHEFSGQVSRLGREADRETREFVVDVRILALPTNWAVGQRADVYIETERKADIPIVPAAFIVWQDDDPGVFIRNKNVAEWRPVSLGMRRPDLIEVVHGVESGESIVMPRDGKTHLRAGRRIYVP